MKNQKGFLILEALISVVILSMVLLSLFSMISFLQRRTTQSDFDSDASLLMQEGIEITHTVLISNWNSFPDGEYMPVFDADTQNWILIEGNEEGLQGIFNRTITLKKVCRNSVDGVLLDVPGMCTGLVDENSRIIETRIEWEDRGSAEVAQTSLLVFKLPE